MVIIRGHTNYPLREMQRFYPLIVAEVCVDAAAGQAQGLLLGYTMRETAVASARRGILRDGSEGDPAAGPDGL